MQAGPHTYPPATEFNLNLSVRQKPVGGTPNNYSLHLQDQFHGGEEYSLEQGKLRGDTQGRQASQLRITSGFNLLNLNQIAQGQKRTVTPMHLHYRRSQEAQDRYIKRSNSTTSEKNPARPTNSRPKAPILQA